MEGHYTGVDKFSQTGANRGGLVALGKGYAACKMVSPGRQIKILPGLLDKKHWEADSVSFMFSDRYTLAS
jgi:hypothetical protein